MLQPTRLTLFLALVLPSLVALSAWWHQAGWLALGWVLILLTLVWTDWRLTPGPQDWRVTRTHDARLSLAAQNQIRITLTLRKGFRKLPVWLRDEVPSVFQISEGDRVLSGEAIPGQQVSFTYAVYPPRRGDYRFGDVHLRWQSLMGLFRRQSRYPLATPVKVYPNLVDVRKYDLLLRRNRLWELGLRHTRVLGRGSDFERLRDYVPDDEYRRINWKATARRGKPVSVEFETERSQNLMVMLDIGRVMRSPVGSIARLDYAINAVLLLAYVAVQRGDRMGCLTFADTVQTWVAPRTGKGQFIRLLETLYAVESQPVEPAYDVALSHLAARQRKRSLVLLFTDITGSVSVQSLLTHMARLGRHHLPLLITIADPTVQRLANQQISDGTHLYQRTVAEQMLQERVLTLERLKAQGVHTLDVPADELTIAVINKYLELKAQTLL